MSTTHTDPRDIQSPYRVRCLRPGRDIMTKEERKAGLATYVDIAPSGPCPSACLTQEEYERQMLNIIDKWRCPLCEYEAEFDDEWYETHI